MKYEKICEDFEQKKRVTFQDKEGRCFAITRDYLEMYAECNNFDKIDFTPYSNDFFDEQEKAEIIEMVENQEFEKYLEWD